MISLPLLSVAGGLISRKAIKIYLIAFMVFSVSVGGYVLYNKVWDSGYERAQLEYEAELSAVLSEAVDNARQEWQRNAAIAAELLEMEKDMEESVNARLDNVSEVIDHDKCSHIGADALELFNSAISEGGN